MNESLEGLPLRHHSFGIPRPQQILREDLLCRLRWNIFGEKEDISVDYELDDEPTAPIPFLDHPLASESLAFPPLKRAHVSIRACEQREDCWFVAKHEGCWYPKAPGPFLIENPDGRPLTIKDFVLQLHPNLKAHKEDIIEAERQQYGGLVHVIEQGAHMVSLQSYDAHGEPEEVTFPAAGEFWFSGFHWPRLNGDEARLQVTLFVDGQRIMGYGTRISTDEFWNRQRTRGKHWKDRLTADEATQLGLGV